MKTELVNKKVVLKMCQNTTKINEEFENMKPSDQKVGMRGFNIFQLDIMLTKPC